MGKEIFQGISVAIKEHSQKIFQTDNIYENSEIVFSDKNDNLQKYENKKILVLGGGPTTKTINWKKLDYDYVWSINRFYQNEDLFNIELDLIHFGTLVDFDDSLLREYLNTNGKNSSIYFESNHIRQNIWDYLQNSDFLNLYGDRCNFYMTKFKGCMGAANRLVLLAGFTGASDVYFAGIDGFTRDNRRLHAFWKDGDTETKNVPGQHAEKGGDAVYGYSDFSEGYGHYVDYLNQITSDVGVKFHNLGEGHECNIIGLDYKNKLPLSKKIMEVI